VLHTRRTGDIHEIRHVIVIMEENRSFDSFFGTYPRAAGIPMKHGVPTVCVPNGVGGCVEAVPRPERRRRLGRRARP